MKINNLHMALERNEKHKRPLSDFKYDSDNIITYTSNSALHGHNIYWIEIIYKLITIWYWKNSIYQTNVKNT